MGKPTFQPSPKPRRNLGWMGATPCGAPTFKLTVSGLARMPTPRCGRVLRVGLVASGLKGNQRETYLLVGFAYVYRAKLNVPFQHFACCVFHCFLSTNDKSTLGSKSGLLTLCFARPKSTRDCLEKSILRHKYSYSDGMFIIKGV